MLSTWPFLHSAPLIIFPVITQSPPFLTILLINTTLQLTHFFLLWFLKDLPTLSMSFSTCVDAVSSETLFSYSYTAIRISYHKLYSHFYKSFSSTLMQAVIADDLQSCSVCMNRCLILLAQDHRWSRNIGWYELYQDINEVLIVLGNHLNN